ncbi:MAG: hypothetical protein ACFB0C_11885 [Leptolyngbyaceae cyanobacterium]
MRYSIRDNNDPRKLGAHQFTDDAGNLIPCTNRLVPEILTDQDLQNLARQKLRALKP